jgi:signal transduction histidine kinase
MKQGVMILLDNAVKYATAGSTVTASVSRADGAVTATVRNCGERLDAAELPRLTERAYRGRKAAGGANGSGLGLSIASWMVERQRGSIALAPLDPGGLAVTLRFPAADRSASRQRAGAPAAPGP